MIRKAKFSVAKAILAVLWRKERADTRLLLNHKYLHQLCAGHNKGTYRSSLARLFKKGYLNRESGVLTLNDTSRPIAQKSFIEAELELYQPDNEWDGGWRIILFNVPESKRKHRDYLRNLIRKVGFKELQKSIWVCPYPVPSFMKEILLGKDVKEYARLITSEGIENDHDLRALFKLHPKTKTA